MRFRLKLIGTACQSPPPSLNCSTVETEWFHPGLSKSVGMNLFRDPQWNLWVFTLELLTDNVRRRFRPSMLSFFVIVIFLYVVGFAECVLLIFTLIWFKQSSSRPGTIVLSLNIPKSMTSVILGSQDANMGRLIEHSYGLHVRKISIVSAKIALSAAKSILKQRIYLTTQRLTDVCRHASRLSQDLQTAISLADFQMLNTKSTEVKLTQGRQCKDRQVRTKVIREEEIIPNVKSVFQKLPSAEAEKLRVQLVTVLKSQQLGAPNIVPSETLKGNSSTFIRNSYDFANKVTGLPVDMDEVLVSFDVASMYTNIPRADALEIQERLKLLNSTPKVRVRQYCVIDVSSSQSAVHRRDRLNGSSDRDFKEKDTQ
ncbi:hypothetical protein CLF_103529 [Clonorchis sinensis]|uniref:Uncharacterized protein n=1 Tax=Clonorchis sinensis TaxID=79923 RepID=G7Y9X5_CLOSI|nr:hypothetical protein CLF_103529 [Clonorchis sinensis]